MAGPVNIVTVEDHISPSLSPSLRDAERGLCSRPRGRNCAHVNMNCHIHSAQSAFTMVEIALSLAVIGIALVAIIGVLPIGMNVQKDNREETIINQDATVFIQGIRNGASSPYATDLTNYVYAITNFQTVYPRGAAVVPAPGWGSSYLTNNARIIGLMSWPEYTDNNGNPIPYLVNGYSNHVVAYVRSISGAAVEKPPQDNPIVQQDSFGYKIICDNVPVAVDTRIWQAQSYNAGDVVFYSEVFWRATAITGSGDIPGVSPLWTQNSYAQQLTANLHELRLTFLWPLLPSGNTGAGWHTFSTTVGGQITVTYDTSVTPNQPLYFLQSQSFTSVPPP
jgi:type II secretory pathway pseudopilin PulG